MDFQLKNYLYTLSQTCLASALNSFPAYHIFVFFGSPYKSSVLTFFIVALNFLFGFRFHRQREMDELWEG